ncbi:DUF4295 family protein [Blattabacterium cuenoti]|uniref:DUF4295 family protein n=1 Tax=Blattabacterium cuenoti TaxID=1653831 RepID=UPI00163BF51C|nr:DUF4295 family protein [Blattabacterium cuenoti]
MPTSTSSNSNKNSPKKIIIENKKKISKKMTLAIKIIKSKKKSGSYIFEEKMLIDSEVKDFLEKND